VTRAFALLIGAQGYPHLADLPGTIGHLQDFYHWLVDVRGAARDDVFVCASPPLQDGGWSASREDIRLAATALVDRGQN
jgi:hypothetical protein